MIEHLNVEEEDIFEIFAKRHHKKNVTFGSWHGCVRGGDVIKVSWQISCEDPLELISIVLLLSCILDLFLCDILNNRMEATWLFLFSCHVLFFFFPARELWWAASQLGMMLALIILFLTFYLFVCCFSDSFFFFLALCFSVISCYLFVFACYIFWWLHVTFLYFCLLLFSGLPFVWLPALVCGFKLQI